jgi:hypothetical protein
MAAASRIEAAINHPRTAVTVTPPTACAIAIDIRENDSRRTLVGVALALPSIRHLSVLTDGARAAIEPPWSRAAWSEIDGWITRGDNGLPVRPAPLSDAIVSALIPGDRRSLTASRFASIDLCMAPDPDLADIALRMLPELLERRRVA